MVVGPRSRGTRHNFALTAAVEAVRAIITSRSSALIKSAKKYRTLPTNMEIPRHLLTQLLNLIFRKNGFSAEVANQIKRYSERYDILEKEQAQKTHVPHTVNSRNGNNRTGGS